ncbi:SDR family NAD(P)-dependent oxidoreductase [Chelativorans sp. ZYF759]|uniref:oxidoreductase n=1 Tax=Chelativorans sp. ZYF759 TaxID=2692213 RepID=UPI00145F4636|nr:oxidoreductase [Chelativorans sp. ZYF759]NMG41821.1 SDR family NAD(P)-dependent oxidoreductase [Chelativorans sp. ZYF759]
MSQPPSAKTPRVWLITGCSSGLGRAFANEVLARGDAAVVSARNTDAVADIVAAHPESALAVDLDVTSDSSVESAVERAVAWRGRIDVLVNNAGFGTVGATEEIDDVEGRAAFEANFFGVHRMLKAVLPHMRAQAGGHVLNISSMLGFSGAAGFSFYSAAKFAVEGLSESLAKEVAPFGIKVTIIEPGPFRTDFRNRSLHTAPLHEAYRETLGPFRENMMAADGKQPGDPAKAAALVFDVVDEGDAPLRLPLGEICIGQMRQKIEQVEGDIARWQTRSRATAFD